MEAESWIPIFHFLQDQKISKWYGPGTEICQLGFFNSWISGFFRNKILKKPTHIINAEPHQPV